MKIGFDLDGVLASQSIPELIFVAGNPFAEDQYYGTLVPQLNPAMFLGKDDWGYIITARKERLSSLTKEWCRLHFPSYKLYHVKVPQWKSTETKDIEKWQYEVAKRKAKLINELDLDVYFEDMPETVETLRQLCPKCKIIQYGGRVR